MTGHQSGYPLYFYGAVQELQGDYDRITQQIQSHLVSTASLYQLPPSLEDFTGRSAELRQIFSVVNQNIYERRKTATVIVITGQAGVGKSSLAVQLAHGLKSTFLDVQLYVDLGGTEQYPKQPKKVLAGLLKRLGIDENELPEGEAERLNLVQSQLMDKQSLLLLDNAVDENQVRSLIPIHCCSVVLITSRKPFTDLDGATVLNVAELSEAEALDLLYRLINKEVIQLPSSMAQKLIQRCHYLPLSIRLAASAIQHQPSKLISEHLEQIDRHYQQVRLLRSSHAEVRPSFLFNYQQLTPDAARLLRLLGLLTESHFTSAMAATLLEVKIDDVGQAVGQLVDLKLVKRIGGGHYQIVHDIVRLLARGQLATEEPPEARQWARMRISQWYLDVCQTMALSLDAQGCNILAQVANKAKRQPISKAEQQLIEGTLNWFETERSNLLAAVEWTSQIEANELLIELTKSLALFFDYRKDWADWQRTNQLAIDVAHQLKDSLQTAQLMNNLANFYLRQNQFEQAKELYEQSITLFQSIGESDLEAKTLTNLGVLYLHFGQLELAIQQWNNALHRLPKASREQQRLQRWMQHVEPKLWQQLHEAESGDRTSSRRLFQSVGNAIRRFILE
ncbi:hypothetical protein C7B76_06935 [filamentous cyanobacterium CCP2]|nr:hypothetical protein C7B76_06935 [filamentous cyanobacterium CCP2]